MRPVNSQQSKNKGSVEVCQYLSLKVTLKTTRIPNTKWSNKQHSGTSHAFVLLLWWRPTCRKHENKVTDLCHRKQNLLGSSSWLGLHVLTPALLPALSSWCDPWRPWHNRERQLSTEESIQLVNSIPLIEKTKNVERTDSHYKNRLRISACDFLSHWHVVNIFVTILITFMLYVSEVFRNVSCAGGASVWKLTVTQF